MGKNAHRDFKSQRCHSDAKRHIFHVWENVSKQITMKSRDDSDANGTDNFEKESRATNSKEPSDRGSGKSQRIRSSSIHCNTYTLRKSLRKRQSSRHMHCKVQLRIEE